MDGNGRWAKKHFLNRVKGHEKGTKTVRTIVETSREIGISTLTLYAFSTENWQRPKIEVLALMSLLSKFIKSEEKNLMDNNIRLEVIGQIERLPADPRGALKNAITRTAQNDAMLLNLALSYGSRDEIVRMVKLVSRQVMEGTLDHNDITADVVADNLYTKGLPDPDLLIRTGGDMRVSNFLLWQIAYTELHVTRTLWPDLKKDEFLSIIKNYQQRERRFGKVIQD